MVSEPFQNPDGQPDAGGVVAKAFVRAGKALALGQQDLAEIVGVSAASLSRIAAGRALRPESKEFELALLFLRVYRSIDALVGGREEKCARWFHAENDHLRGVPAELVKSVTGLVHVAEYLDAMRGKL